MYSRGKGLFPSILLVLPSPLFSNYLAHPVPQKPYELEYAVLDPLKAGIR